jgi:hypothetical protein
MEEENNTVETNEENKVLSWQQDWNLYYAPFQKRQIKQELSKHGVEIPESEWEGFLCG